MEIFIVLLCLLFIGMCCMVYLLYNNKNKVIVYDNE